MKDTISPAAEVREFAPGIGRAVADRTVARKVIKQHDGVQFHNITLPRDDKQSLDAQVAKHAKNEGLIYSGYHVKHGNDRNVVLTLYVTGEERRENWVEVADRVALGNASLNPADFDSEVVIFADHLRRATTLMSGRHLQHGDENQKNRPFEVFTNCSTAPLTSLSFYLLLNGSGVGRDYSDEMMVADWADMPIVVPVISETHADVASGLAAGYSTIADVEHLYADRKITIFNVPDSREGWAEGVAKMEEMAYEKRRDEVLVLDFSEVRPNGAPIGGMQSRPASGPGPLMSAIVKIAALRDAGMPAWRSNLYADHYCAAVVLVGGARRAARMSTKWWMDPGVLDFVKVKMGGRFLWSSNNSVTVDAQFWTCVKNATTDNEHPVTELDEWALKVFNAVTEASYKDGTGEPGFINVDMFDAKIPKGGVGEINFDHVLDTTRLNFTSGFKEMMVDVVERGAKSSFPMITNPCGEIQLVKWGGYCVIADVVPYHADNLDDAEQAFRATTRALIRTNLMNPLFKGEVKRTNRIGVGITGLHEFALKFFGYGWHDLVDEKKSQDFWDTIARFARAVKIEATIYAGKLGVASPHTDTTMKPAGTTSKLFGLTEGAHLPAMLTYLRWVQFRSDDPLVEEYKAKGYPTKTLRSYDGTTVVGFPTAPAIVELARELGLEDKLVTAAEATPEEQFEYLRLLEKYWIAGNMKDDTGNQISYTLKYDPEQVDFDAYRASMLKNMPTVKCVSVMPQVDTTAYEYQPEEPVTKEVFERIAAEIANAQTAQVMEESIDYEHLACDAGGCPISFDKDGI